MYPKVCQSFKVRDEGAGKTGKEAVSPVWCAVYHAYNSLLLFSSRSDRGGGGVRNLVFELMRCISHSLKVVSQEK